MSRERELEIIKRMISLEEKYDCLLPKGPPQPVPPNEQREKIAAEIIKLDEELDCLTRQRTTTP